MKENMYITSNLIYLDSNYGHSMLANNIIFSKGVLHPEFF